MDKENIKKIIEIAFKDGEQWGITHHDWFIPTQEQIDERIRNTTETIFKQFKIK